MSSAAAKADPTPINQLATMQAIVAGKISDVRRHENVFYTTVLCPAADEFSSPSVVEIRSKDRIGQREDLCRVKVKVGGFLGRPFMTVDKDTGERRQVRQCRITLDLDE